MEVILSVAGIIIVGLLITQNVYLRIKNKQMFMNAAQAEIDRLAVYTQAQEVFKREAEKLEGKDGFIKFMSQSRDWAFEYIETVQADLYNLKELVDEIGVKPKTVAQANDLNARIEKVLTNLPDDKKKENDV